MTKSRITVWLVLLFAIVVGLLSHGNPQWGRWVYVWQNHVLKSPTEVPEGYSGVWSVWDASGKLTQRSTFTKGELNGDETIWNVGEFSKVISHYKMNQIDSLKAYGDTGLIKVHNQYFENADKKVRLNVLFDDEGVVDRITAVVNEKREWVLYSIADEVDMREAFGITDDNDLSGFKLALEESENRSYDGGRVTLRWDEASRKRFINVDQEGERELFIFPSGAYFDRAYVPVEYERYYVKDGSSVLVFKVDGEFKLVWDNLLGIDLRRSLGFKQSFEELIGDNWHDHPYDNWEALLAASKKIRLEQQK